jgi:protein phosphatase 1 regulatory subunit 11
MTSLSQRPLREGSQVVVAVQEAEQGDVSDTAAGPGPTGTLRLRGGPRSRPRVVWSEDVVDNEGLGRKKSKSACTRTGERQMGTIIAAFFLF